MLSPMVLNVQRQHKWKRGSGDGQRLSLYDYGTSDQSFNAVERQGSTLTWTVCTAADMICYDMLSPIVEHTSVWEGVGGRGEIRRGSPQWNTKAQLPKPHTRTVATAQWPNYSSTYPNNPAERTASTEQISKKGIKLTPKTLGNRKGDCARSCSRWQKQPEKSANCKAQISTISRVNDTDLYDCDLQIFSGCACHLEQLHAQSPFLFPIVFDINLL